MGSEALAGLRQLWLLRLVVQQARGRSVREEFAWMIGAWKSMRAWSEEAQEDESDCLANVAV